MKPLRARVDRLLRASRLCRVVFARIAPSLTEAEARILITDQIGPGDIWLFRSGDCETGIEIADVRDLGELLDHVAERGGKIGRPRHRPDTIG